MMRKVEIVVLNYRIDSSKIQIYYESDIQQQINK